MTLTWKSILAVVFVVAVLFLLASVPAVQADEVPSFTVVDDSAELIAEKSDWVPEPGPTSNQHERLPESPGGAIAKVTSETKVTDNAKEVLPGGAAGSAGIGIRGPTAA